MNKFKNNNYENALEYVKHILSSSASMSEIVEKTRYNEKVAEDIIEKNKAKIDYRCDRIY